ncbi:SANT domain-containing protein [Naegleria gruberi]|uniref:SANT domain-containing protein n=1 Tax=Naegleria gruberi TaxID=5762 RepID=D2V1P6_NAEGR|nr:SANT domain-containing protein [Naegleria gruberi]EFC49197.1 SANT domain-containing protein [Naegleria gruberi]|eukprot:XP_002681941.1 SANT domain-containing protein [Naegleria gruberi strain NEG-M]
MNFESNIPKNSSLEDFFSGVFNTSASHSFMMNNDDNMYLDENVNEFFGTSPEQDPFSSYFPFNNNNNSFYATSFPENSSPINNINETQQQIAKSSSILSLTDFKPSFSRTSSSTSFAGLQTPSILHNGESSPMESFHQMDEFQRQLDEDFLRNGGVTSLNISSESAFKPRSDQHLFKFNKQMDFLSGIPKPSTTESNQDIFASLNDISESLIEEPPKDSTIDAMDTSSVNSKTTPGLPPGHKIINGEMYNDRGYKICGFMNQHNRPCQRIGKCPFHDRMKSDKPLSTNSDGIIAAQDSIEPEHFAPTQVVKEKKKSEKKSKKKQDETLLEVPSVESLTTSTTTASASTTTEDKPATKKPYKQGWTKEEHILFLKGLELHGKGSWKEISAIVGTRSPTQIQSHAQKYFLRQKQQKKNKRSIHDFTMDDMKKQDSVEEVEENNHKRKRNKSKSKESKKTGAVHSEDSLSSEPQLEVFGETLVGDANASLMKQFTLAPPKPQQPQPQDANYMDIINKLNHLKSFPKQSPSTGKSSAFSSVSSDELDFHFNTNNESIPTVTEEHSDLYDAWEIGESSTIDDVAPFQKKIKL